MDNQEIFVDEVKSGSFNIGFSGGITFTNSMHKFARITDNILKKKNIKYMSIDISKNDDILFKASHFWNFCESMINSSKDAQRGITFLLRNNSKQEEYFPGVAEGIFSKVETVKKKELYEPSEELCNLINENSIVSETESEIVNGMNLLCKDVIQSQNSQIFEDAGFIIEDFEELQIAADSYDENYLYRKSLSEQFESIFRYFANNSIGEYSARIYIVKDKKVTLSVRELVVNWMDLDNYNLKEMWDVLARDLLYFAESERNRSWGKIVKKGKDVFLSIGQ